MKNWRAMMLIVLTVIADQVSKWMITSAPVFNAMDENCLFPPTGVGISCGHQPVAGPIDLTMVWNYGMSFGLFQSQGIGRWILSALMIVIAIGFAIWLVRASGWLLRLSLALVIGGAIGNVIDRIRYGAVVDFINASDLYFPWVFNIADSAICVGAVLLFLDQFLLSGKKQAKQHVDSIE